MTTPNQPPAPCDCNRDPNQEHSKLCKSVLSAPLTMSAEREAEIRRENGRGRGSHVQKALLRELDATRKQRDALKIAERLNKDELNYWCKRTPELVAGAYEAAALEVERLASAHKEQISRDEYSSLRATAIVLRSLTPNEAKNALDALLAATRERLERAEREVVNLALLNHERHAEPEFEKCGWSTCQYAASIGARAAGSFERGKDSAAAPAKEAQ